jgi:alpha-D-ribose 1-methylphosphonate 5-triphosphate diphosphatase PhnM
MASKFFSSIKNAFVTEIPDEAPTVVETNTKQDVVPSQQTAQPMFTVTATPTTHVIEGQVNDELLQKLCQAMEDSNLPGPDYLELKNVANNDEMKKAMPNEIQRLTVAFITMKSSTPEMTRDRVLNSIESYIQMMENERKTGHAQLETIWQERVESQRQAVTEAEERIVKLQKELGELVSFVQNKTNEIAAATNECNINKANFDATVDFLVKNLADDKAKLTNVLV